MKAMSRMSRTSRTVIPPTIVQTSANMAGLPVRVRGGGADVVFAGSQDVGAALDRQDRRGDRPFEPLVRRQAEDLPEEGLPREAEEQGPAEPVEELLTAQDLEVVVERLAEADARVDDDALTGNARGLGDADPFGQEVADLADEVVVAGGSLHRQRRSLHV